MTPALPRFAAVLAVVLLGVGRLAAAPRDELLRLAPPDAAIVVVLQNARDHIKNLAESPFAAWFPSTHLGKHLLDSADFRKTREAGAMIFGQLGVTPDEVFGDIVGDAAAFAFTPGSADGKTPERAVILVRPRKLGTLQKLIDRLNELQTKSGELKAVVRHEHNGGAYFERQKASGGSEFYAFRGGVFAFSGSEADVRAVLDRDPDSEKASELAGRLARLGVADAAAVLLFNPRAFDAEIGATIGKAKGDEKAFLAQFGKVWAALDDAAVYLDLGRDLELGAVLRFRPDALPAGLRGWLVGPRTPAGLWAAIPENALLAVAGRVNVSELTETLGALMPDEGKNAVRAGVNQFLGPAIGRNKLPAVLDALGPDWAVWAQPPAAGGGFLPVVVAALQVRTDAPGGADAAKSLGQAVEFGFQMARFAYNAGHADQIDLREMPDDDAVIRFLANDKAFPPGFRPSFALKGGYLLLATSPEAIKSFRPPTGAPKPGGEVPFARFSGTSARAYLLAHREPLAKFLSDAGAGSEKEVLTHLDQFAAVLELLDRAELLSKADGSTTRLLLRVKFTKPLKK